MTELLQFTFSGLTVGAIYALVALGFTIIYNASDVVNFSQGEFVMLGGMITAFFFQSGLNLPLSALFAVLIVIVVGNLLNKFAIEPAKGASVVTLIIITIGASIFLRGMTQIVLDKQIHSLPAFSGEDPIVIFGATLLPQSLWVMLGAAVIFVGLYIFFTKTIAGKSVLATANNRMAAKLVGIDTKVVMALSFGLSAGVGAFAGVMITPISLTSYDIGVMLALKGFAGAMLGGMGNPFGALIGGLIVGLLEAYSAGYISSDYKDAAAFILILLVLFFMPQGLFGSKSIERV